MSYKFIFVISLLIACYNANSMESFKDLLVCGQDSIFINYHIAYFGEYGGADEGVILFEDDGALKAKYVKYNSGNNPSFNLSKKGIVEYFSGKRGDYRVIKDVWVLDSSQIAFVNKLIDDLKTYIPEKGVSNAAEFYHLSLKGNEYVVIDRLSTWNKYQEIHQSFKIKVKKPRRIYFLGIQIKPKDIEYIVN